MNPAALALRSVLLGRRTPFATLMVAASLSVLELYAGHVAASAPADAAARTGPACVALAMLVVVAATVGSMTSLNTMERGSLLATLRALGMRPRGVFALVIFEAVWITIFAAALGLALHGLAGWILEAVASWLRPSLRELQVLLEVDVARMLLVFVAVLAVAILAALGPAFKAAQADVARGLRWDFGHPGW